MSSLFIKKIVENGRKNFLTVRTNPRPHNCFQRTTGEFEGVLQTPLMPCPAVCCKVSEAFCPYNGKSDTGTGKLCFSVSVGVAYGTGQIVTVKGERVEISARKYYPYLDWLKAERAVSAIKKRAFFSERPFYHLRKRENFFFFSCFGSSGTETKCPYFLIRV